MKRNLNRGISLLLSVCLVLGIFAGSGLTLARAEDVESAEQLPVTLPNLIANGTFGGYRDVTSYTANKVPASWSGTNTSKLEGENYLESTNRYVYDGKYAIHAVANTSAVAFSLGQTFVFADHGISAGDTLTMTAYVRGSVTASGANFKLDIRGGDNAKAFNTSYTYKNVSNEWTKIEVTAEVPEGTTSVVAQPLYVGKATVFDIYVDNVVLTLTKKDTGVVSDLGLKNASFETPDADATATTTTEFFKDFTGWTAGGADFGTVSAEVDPADASNVVLMLNDTSAQPLDEAGNPIQDTNNDGTPKVDKDGNPVWKQGNYPAAYYGGFAVTPGKTYTFSMKYKVANPEDAQTLTVNLRGNDSSSKGIKLNSGSAKNLTTEWQTLTISTKEIPAGVETFYVAINTAKDATGIVYIDDVTLTLDCEHNWAGGECADCGATCQHKVEAGVCTICGEEFPASYDENLVVNGTFNTEGGAVTNYILTKDAYCNFGDWVYGGNAPTEQMYVAVSNAWASEGNWSIYVYDYETSAENYLGKAFSISINMYVPAPGSTPETLISLGADYAGVDGLKVTAVPYVQDEEGKFVQVATNDQGETVKSVGLGTIAGDGSKTVKDKTINANYDWLQVKIATNRDTVSVGYIDDIFVTVNGGENLLSNASFETLPVGVKPVADSFDASLDTTNWNNITEDGTFGIEFEEGSTNGVLHVDDNSDTLAGQSPANLSRALKANTSYILTYRYKYVDGNMPAVYVREAKTSDYAQNDVVKYTVKNPIAGEWTPVRIEFTTSDYETTRTLFVSAGGASLGEAYFDDFVLIEVCDHEFKLVEVIEANCVSAGYRNVACVNCGVEGTTLVAEKNAEHVWADANCDSPKHCTVCGCGETEGEALGHTWVDGVCSACEKICGHKYTDDEGNSTNGICFICGIGCDHADCEVTVTNAPTCTESGLNTLTCKCGYTTTVATDPLGHNYVDGACTNCGEADPSVPTGPAVDVVLNPKRVALGLGGSIEAQFYLNYKAIKNVYTNVYVKIIMDVYDGNGVATKTEYILTDGIVSGSSNLVFIYGVAPCYMGRNMEVQVFATKDGVEYCSEISEYSIKKGIMERLEEAYLTKDSDTQMSNLCTLLVDMLYYGAEAQKTFGQAQYDGLVTEGLDEKYVALKTETIPEATLTNTAVKNNTVHELHAYNLGLGQAVDMQFTFRLASADYTGYTVKVTWGDGNERVFTADEFYVKSSKYNRVAVVFNNLGAPEMDVEVSVALYKDGVQVSSTYTSSIEANAKTHLDAGTNVDLVNAMLNYGNSAKRLFGL